MPGFVDPAHMIVYGLVKVIVEKFTEIHLGRHTCLQIHWVIRLASDPCSHQCRVEALKQEPISHHLGLAHHF